MSTKKVILLSAPSGSGKTTIIHFLLKQFDMLRFSVSATTRAKRPNEVDGQDYYFVDMATFQQQVSEGKFLEWERVYQDVCYGTYLSEISRIQSLGYIPILDLDVVGGINTKRIYGEDCCSIFIYVPDTMDLKKRLLERGMADDKTLQERLDKADFEKKQAHLFDHCVQNIHIEAACETAKQIVHSFISSH